MSCKVVFTETAKADLRDIVLRLAGLTKDKATAIRFVKELRAQTEILKDFPECGALPKDRMLKSDGYRFLSHKDYLLFYRYNQEENTVYITAVFNGKLDYMRVMRKYL